MKYDYDTDNDTMLLVSIFQKANPIGPSSVADYLAHFEFEIDRMGSVLRFLGLAKKSNRVLNWAPNHRLMRLIAEKATRPFQERGEIVVTKADREFVASMQHLATGDVKDGRMDTTDFCCNVLAILDLLEKGKGKDGGFKPTPRIKDLVLEHFMRVSKHGCEGEEQQEGRRSDEEDGQNEDD
jgi:hypothetical protein